MQRMNSSDLDPFRAAESNERCRRLRKRILDISQQVKALHIAGAFSCMEVVETIYFHLMDRGTNRDTEDTFLMSKGHGCMAQYVALEELGVLSEKDISEYCTSHGILGVHPDYGNPGIEASTGSLGHGLTLAVGMAYADKLSGKRGTVYAVLSDGEMQEGSTWEGMMIAPTLGVSNLVAFLDLNDFQSLGRTSEVLPNFYPINAKVESFGWEVAEVSGHDTGALFDAVRSRKTDKPMMVLAKTTKGKGVSYMENVPIWHYRAPNADEYKTALRELGFAQ